MDSQTNRKRSILLRYGRFDARRRSTLICCRRTRISASSFALDLKSEARAPRISLNRSVIRSRAYPVFPLRLCRIQFSVHTRVNFLILLSLDALPCSIAKRERAAVEKGFFGHDGMMLHPIKFLTRNSDALTAATYERERELRSGV